MARLTDSSSRSLVPSSNDDELESERRQRERDHPGKNVVKMQDWHFGIPIEQHARQGCTACKKMIEEELGHRS